MITLTVSNAIEDVSAKLHEIINQLHPLAGHGAPTLKVQPPKRGRRRLPASRRGDHANRRSRSGERFSQSPQRTSRVISRSNHQQRMQTLRHRVVFDYHRAYRLANACARVGAVTMPTVVPVAANVFRKV